MGTAAASMPNRTIDYADPRQAAAHDAQHAIRNQAPTWQPEPRTATLTAASSLPSR